MMRAKMKSHQEENKTFNSVSIQLLHIILSEKNDHEAFYSVVKLESEVLVWVLATTTTIPRLGTGYKQDKAKGF